MLLLLCQIETGINKHDFSSPGWNHWKCMRMIWTHSALCIRSKSCGPLFSSIWWCYSAIGISRWYLCFFNHKQGQINVIWAPQVEITENALAWFGPSQHLQMGQIVWGIIFFSMEMLFRYRHLLMLFLSFDSHTGSYQYNLGWAG